MAIDQTKLGLYRREPVVFVREEFGVEPDAWQVNALNAFRAWDREKLRISLQACAGPGKSAVLAWCGWNFLLCYAEPNEHPRGACVSVSWDNLQDNLWSEMAKWQAKSALLTEMFTWTKTRIFNKQFEKTWFLSARSFPQTADRETIGKTLSGVHAKYVLFLIDESGAIPPEVGKAAEQAVGETLGRSGFAKILQAGNPISLDGMLYAASVADDWYVIRITGDPDDINRSPRIDIQWARDQIIKYGRDDSWVMSYLLGRFPKSAINTLLSVDIVEDAMKRHLRPSQYNFVEKRLGVDVARGGLDRTIIFPRQGLASFKYGEMAQADGPQVAARIMQAKHKWGAEREFIDDTGGFGSSVIDAAKMAGMNPIGVHFSSKAIDVRYFNKRAEMWFLMAEWIKRGGAIPSCPKLKKELTAVMYTLKDGRLKLEDKDQLKSRLGFSPDRADALALTFALPDSPARNEFEEIRDTIREVNGSSRNGHDYNPFGSAS